MVEWLYKACQVIELRDHTYFVAIYILDKFFSETQALRKSINKDTLYLAGITSLFIASKLEEINPISVKLVEKDLGHHSFSQD